jgi:branched-subunit amino acid transport protein
MMRKIVLKEKRGKQTMAHLPIIILSPLIIISVLCREKRNPEDQNKSQQLILPTMLRNLMKSYAFVILCALMTDTFAAQ